MNNNAYLIGILLALSNITHGAQIEHQSTYVSQGLNEIATWLIVNNEILPETICRREALNERYLRCLDGAREILAGQCINNNSETACNSYRWISRNKEYLEHRRAVNSQAKFSEYAREIDPSLPK